MALLTNYDPAGRKCSGGPTSGVRELMSWWLGAYGRQGGTNLGIYNCRPVRGGSAMSLHAEGRAGDLGVNPHRADYGWVAANALRSMSLELGVQCIIWDRKIWSGSRAHAGWRNYGGSNAHVDHLHVELTRHMASRLTAEHIIAVLGGPPRPPASPPAGGGSRMLRLQDPMLRGDDVRDLQRVLAAWYPHLRLAVDGWFGKATEAAVRELQRRAGIGVDGVVGPQTRRVLGL